MDAAEPGLVRGVSQGIILGVEHIDNGYPFRGREAKVKEPARVQGLVT
jgi:hypothetical protein